MNAVLEKRLADFDRESLKVEIWLGVIFALGAVGLFSLVIPFLGSEVSKGGWIGLVFLGWGALYGIVSQELRRKRVRRLGLVCDSCGSHLVKDLRETAEKYDLCGKCGERPIAESN